MATVVDAGKLSIQVKCIMSQWLFMRRNCQFKKQNMVNYMKNVKLMWMELMLEMFWMLVREFEL